MADKPIRILIIGEFPPPSGGVTISLNHLFNHLSRSSIVEPHKLDLTPSRKMQKSPYGKSPIIKNILSILRFLLTLPRAAWRSDVISLHIVSNKLPIYGPYSLLICRLFRKPFIVRKFGGTDPNSYNLIWRTLSILTLRLCNAYLAQTQDLVQAGKRDKIDHVHWFPTHRPLPNTKCKKPTKPCFRFIYLGQVRVEKGILVLADALDSLPSSSQIEVDIYGPISDDILSREYINSRCRMKYCGTIPADEVHTVLSQYDAFIFPTFWHGEGYPGAVIEALSVGLPVIATNWRAVPEVVTLDCGIIVPPQDNVALREAMETLRRSPDLWQSMHKAALQRGAFFSLSKWSTEFAKLCLRLKGRLAS